MIHGDKYDYSETNYTGAFKNIIIRCKIHGKYEQMARSHLKTKGCAKCSGTFMDQNYFIEKASKIHNNKYDYSKVKYVNNKSIVTIICPDHGEFTQMVNSHISKNGCQKCAGSGTPMNTEDFIERANKKHKGKYDYSKVNYIDSKTKVTIVCKEHNEFKQLPGSHIFGNGCSKCSKRFMDLNFFKEKASKIHNNKYDYSKVDYIDSKTKVIIICPEHMEYQQTPGGHILKKGCPKCAGCFMDTAFFIEKANKIHKNKYDYSKVNYIDNKTKVTIICNNHKKCEKFKQFSGHHLNGSGCPKCAKKFMDTDYFIEKANIIHNNKYDYSKVNYVDSKSKVTIICDVHNKFEQVAGCHIKGNGCPKCCLNQYSNMAINYLNFISKYYNITIQHALNIGEFTIPTTKYKADGYCKESNTVYEFHGNVYHGAPLIYNKNDISWTGKTYGELYEKTIKKEKNKSNKHKINTPKKKRGVPVKITCELQDIYSNYKE